MSNMSYCRFQNTLQDLLACEEALYDVDLSELSAEEQRAAKRLIACCQRIADTCEEEGE